MVTKAMAILGMTKQPSRVAKVASGSRERNGAEPVANETVRALRRVCRCLLEPANQEIQ
jgi:hypothetical protein